VSAAAPLPELDLPYALAPEHVEAFRRDGYVRLPGVLSPDTLARYEPEISRVVGHWAAHKRPLEERDTYGKAFLQITNLWRQSDAVRELVFGQRCARLAAELLGVDGVRLWHDQALYKEARGGATPWHVDQFYWPMASDRSVTVWIPLQDTPLPMGPVAFAPGSQRLDLGRDLPIGDESQERIARTLADAGIPCVEEPFALGDVSFHAGWTFHRAGANRTDAPRRAMTIIYMDAAMRLAEPRNPFQEFDRRTWCPGTEIGAVMASELNPVVWSGGRA